MFQCAIIILTSGQLVLCGTHDTFARCWHAATLKAIEYSRYGATNIERRCQPVRTYRPQQR